ncbi:hypothetical protein AH4AK4_1035 [Aeromonas hydrophila 4AK4]|nr:hypothetical protein AH4AK4_1035 [Aeromonas hydrophila 4AK4]
MLKKIERMRRKEAATATLTMAAIFSFWLSDQAHHRIEPRLA